MTRLTSTYLQRFIKFVIISFAALYCYLLIFGGKNITKFNNNHNNASSVSTSSRTETPALINWRDLSEAQMSRMSTLGKMIFSPEGIIGSVSKPRDGDSAGSKEYLILIWKYGPMLERRHLKHFSQKKFSPWENCSVKNCRLSYESADLEEADAILFHLHKIKGVNDLPENMNYNNRMKQRWIFLTDESPYHTFLGGNQRLANYNGIFNWSMTYRMDSDVPVPYGRTVQAIENPEEIGANLISKKTKLVAIMGSNCGGQNHRWDYVRKLKEILGENLDIYGHCLGGDDKICPGHFTKDCAPLDAYKFYLAFENSNCREYITEKPFWHGYEKNSVPIIMGASKDNCRQILPPQSYIHINDFAYPNALADFLLYLDKNVDEYMKFHEWRKAFKVLNEHGYFQTTSRHYCRICEALNYNEPSAKVYDNLEEFWSVKKDCWSSID